MTCPALTTLQAEAALCIWEAMLDAKSGDRPAPTVSATSANVAAMLEQWDEAGTAAMRHHAIALAPYACAVTDRLTGPARDGFAFDWEVVPAILASVEWIESRPFPPSPDVGALATVRVLQVSEATFGAILPGPASDYVRAL